MNRKEIDWNEKAILSAGVHGKLAEILSCDLKSDHFFDPINKTIFEAMISLDQKNCQPDLISLGEFFAASPEIFNRVMQIGSGELPVTTNLQYHINQLISVSMRKWFHEQLTALINENRVNAEIDIQARVLSLLENELPSRGTVYTDSKFLQDLIDEIEKDIQTGGVKAISTGIKKLDAILDGGLKPGKLVTIAARPGCGKTALACSVVLNAAKQGFSSLYLTNELSDKEILERLLCDAGKIQTSQMASRQFIGDAIDRLAASAGEIHRLPIGLNSQTYGDWHKAELSIRIECKRRAVRLIVIDYIQQFHLFDNKFSPREEITYMTNRCKQLAMKYGITIILIAALNRDIEKRTEKEPYLSDLKESSSIEQDSDIVVMLFKTNEITVGDEIKYELWAKIAKNRQGRIGNIRLNADFSTNSFSN